MNIEEIIYCVYHKLELVGVYIIDWIMGLLLAGMTLKHVTRLENRECLAIDSLADLAAKVDNIKKVFKEYGIENNDMHKNVRSLIDINHTQIEMLGKRTQKMVEIIKTLDEKYTGITDYIINNMTTDRAPVIIRARADNRRVSI